MKSRVLFVDDSGKPEVGHSSKAVVIAGFAIDSDVYPTLARRVSGAKRRFYPHRGAPQAWELKSTSIIKPNAWKRAKNRKLCAELLRLIKTSGGTAYSATIEKVKMHHQMTLDTTMPLELQALVEHFGAECEAMGRMGMVIADWSSHHHDQHASQCVASFAASRALPVHLGVYYASSHAHPGIQVADLVAGVRRRAAEGDVNLAALDKQFAATRACTVPGTTTNGRPFSNWIGVF
jgi:Protein of unknown function (DUF3800)